MAVNPQLAMLVASLAATALLFSLILAGAAKDHGFAGVPPDPWQMKAVMVNGGAPASVWESGYLLHIDKTKITGRICNTFGGEIQYQNASTIRGSAVAFTEMWCGSTLQGPDIMKVERMFQDGLAHGMAVSESGDTLVLRDVETGTAFVYARSISS